MHAANSASCGCRRAGADAVDGCALPALAPATARAQARLLLALSRLLPPPRRKPRPSPAISPAMPAARTRALAWGGAITDGGHTLARRGAVC